MPTASAQDITIDVQVSSERSFTALQSYAHGETATGLLFFGGLADLGLHVFGNNAFPISKFSTNVILVDRATGDITISGTANWPPAVRRALKVTAPAFVQFDEELLVYGGYGPQKGDYNTRPTVAVINLAAVENDIRTLGSVQPGSVTVAASIEGKVAGAGIARLDNDRYILFGGADAEGDYANSGDPIYSDEGHLFDRSISITDPQVTYNDGLGFSSPMHRRDVNVLPVTVPDGTGTRPGFVVMSGVFRNGIFAWETPLIWGDGDTEIYHDETFTQHLGAYEGPVVSLYSAGRRTNSIINCSGLSAYDYHEDTQTFTWNPSTPWTQHITQTRIVDGIFTSETIVGEMPWPLTNAALIVEPSLPRAGNGQVLIDQLPVDTPILLGRIYGGIAAEAPGDEPPTFPSDDVYDVYFTIAGVPGQAATLDAYAINFGSYVSGGLAELSASDDQYMRVQSQFGFQSSQPNILRITCDFTSPLQTPESLDITTELKANNPAGTQRISLYNFDAGTFRTIADQSIGLAEQVHVVNHIDATGYVRASDRRVQLRVHQVFVATFSVSGFRTSFDHIAIDVR
ncbi:MAG: hypothetical protein ACR2GY_14195 [Phycisphaerales bacterium]